MVFLNKEEIKINFSQSAPDYDKHALLQRSMADELFLSIKELQPQRILDIGCGTGYLTRRIAKKFSQAEVVGMDIAPGMIEVATAKNRFKNLRFEVGDGEKLSFGIGDFDLVVSNASLQWMEIEKVLRGIYRILRPGGHFVFSTFGPGTLCELRESGFRVNDFLPWNKLRDKLKERFEVVEIGSRVVKKKFRNVKEIICHLKEIGAHTRDTAAGARILGSFKHYKEKYGGEGYVLTSYEIVFGRALLNRPRPTSYENLGRFGGPLEPDQVSTYGGKR